VRRLVYDLIEEYGRHVGHADLIRESVDGMVGEDPLPGTFPGTTPCSRAGSAARPRPRSDR
jgi:hypothetical protein